MNPDLLRNSLKLATAAFITAAVAVWSVRIAYVWYPLLAVVVVVDDNDDHTLKAASARVLGTVMGGLVTFAVHTVVTGWPGVLVSLLVMMPLLRLLGWQSAASTAGLVSLLFLMIPSHVALDWDYVFNRALDTSVGCLIAIGVSLLFWPRDSLRRLQVLEEGLRGPLRRQLEAYRNWLNGSGERPQPLDPYGLTAALLAMDSLLQQQRSGPQARRLRQLRWPQRLQLWSHVHHHWIAWERLLAGLPNEPCPEPDGGRLDPLVAAVSAMQALLSGQPAAACSSDSLAWRDLARRHRLPALLLLALAEEQRPLVASFSTLRLMVPWG